MIELDWGAVTPEGADIKNNKFTYVFNHNLSSPANVKRTIRFIVGRLLFYDKHLPAIPKHEVKIDARGQHIDPTTSTFIVAEIRRLYISANLQEINIIQ